MNRILWLVALIATVPGENTVRPQGKDACVPPAGETIRFNLTEMKSGLLKAGGRGFESIVLVTNHNVLKATVTTQSCGNEGVRVTC